MKQLFALIILSLTFTGSLFAQEEKTIYVIDGYTLEPLTGFEAISTNEKVPFRIDLNTIVADKKAKGSLTISKEGYNSTIIALFGKGDQTLVLEPTGEQRILLRSKYITTPEIDESETQPLSNVDEPAMYPGEAKDLHMFLARNLNYPQAEIELGIQGKLYIKFVVETDGSITNISIAKGLTKNTEIESIRVLKKMPRWIPGKKDGIVVRSYFNLPITFKLQ